MQDFIKIHDSDNVAVALKTIVTAGGEIPAGHKFALRPIEAGEAVIKYGYPIGYALQDISEGAHVHTHNIRTGLGELLTYEYEPEKGMCDSAVNKDRKRASAASQTFPGYLRADGRVGVRNDIWIIPTVGCVNSVAAAIAAKAKKLVRGTVGEVIAFAHPYGCSQMGEDQENTKKILADLVKHPNAGGVLVLGLGCENCNLGEIAPFLRDYDRERIRFLTASEAEDEIAEGVAIVDALIEHAAGDVRVPVGVDKLVIGLKCGGSDGLSGITANPLVGRLSDKLISAGGTTILTEVPEMFGAETILMNRCVSRELFDKCVAMINGFKKYFTDNGQTIYENPSPGNKAGGISTLEDKSLGCTQKAGSAPVRGVLNYGETVSNAGLNLLYAPGNDLVASTALAAAGAQIVLFTTGRGTPFASPVPTVKISSNTALALRKANWIDFDAGVLAQDVTFESCTEELFAYVLAVAGGEQVKSELAGYHDMAIFKQGVTL